MTTQNALLSPGFQLGTVDSRHHVLTITPQFRRTFPNLQHKTWSRLPCLDVAKDCPSPLAPLPGTPWCPPPPRGDLCRAVSYAGPSATRAGCLPGAVEPRLLPVGELEGAYLNWRELNSNGGSRGLLAGAEP